MPNALKCLKHKRGQIKSSLTRFSAYLNSLDTEINATELRKRKETLEQSLTEFNSVQAEIELLEEVECDDLERENFESSYFKLVSQAEEFLISHSTAARVIPNNDKVDRDNPQFSTQIRLPKIDLPVFYGAYEEWYPFHDTFHSLIHSNSTISDIQKFHYLKSSVKGEAAACLQSLEITSVNYYDAWNILKERYDNKRLIVQKHIKSILDLPVLLKENFKELRQILDGVLKHMRALKSLKRPVDDWDDLIVFIISSKLDSMSAKEWEVTLNTSEMPTFKQITEFLSKKCQTLEALIKKSKPEDTIKPSFMQKNPARFKTSTHIITNQKSECVICKENHPIYRCQTFISKSVNERIQEIRARALCINCMKPNHIAAQCTSGSCKVCHKKHNTLLHLSIEKQPPTKHIESSGHSSTTVSNHSAILHVSSQVLLSTAIINILDVNGQFQPCRALLDSGSQSNLITSKLARRLGLSQRKAQVSISGIIQGTTLVTRTVEAKIQSRHSNFQTLLNCLVLERISEKLPITPLVRTNIKIPANIRLADPDFDQPRDIEVLIGAEYFFKLLCVGQINLGKNQPCLQKTLLGWVISGEVTAGHETHPTTVCNFSTSASLDHMLQKFWELENCSQKTNLTPEEKLCEEHFTENVNRNRDGRFIVTLPFKENSCKLGESREQALKRFHSLEKRLNKDHKLKMEYTSFIHEYLELGHMKKISPVDDSIPHFYMPHHAVIKEKSLTTKLRVVFDGSARTSSGASLNSILLSGPKLQQDLFDILVRFRTFKFVITADVAKMYRQVVMSSDYTQFQRILWRDNEEEAVETYELTTVTYGTAPASFLAIRSLQQLAVEEGRNYPTGSEVILRDFYVDDLLTGANGLTEARQIRDEVTAILSKGGFELRKWSSNASSLLEDISALSNKNLVLDIDNREEVNTLGLQWNSNMDVMQYSVQLPKYSSKITKRYILSTIAKIFDPLGLIGPFIITAKILIQILWELKLDWDARIPMDLELKWLSYAQKIQFISEITIPRNLINVDNPINFELHGFCDASQQAYGACIYLKTVSKSGDISCNLVCSKSRVAPLKVISLPRLELCGALVLAQLMRKTSQALNMKFDNICYWTDSQIVLGWIRSPSRTWKTFVANRISEIHEMSNSQDWHHVSTKDNPADVVSRGSTPRELCESQLWWNGPLWLRSTKTLLSATNDESIVTELPERRQMTLNLVINEEFDWFAKYSSLTKLTRVTAYCLRFKNNLFARKSGSDQFHSGSLKISELNAAMIFLLKLAQRQSFAKDLRRLEIKEQLDSTSNLLCLTPFIDEDGLLRVGGRLKNAILPFRHKHQVLLPGKHPLTKMVIMNEHIKFLHAGVQTTLAAVRDKYWPISGKTAVKDVVSKCLICFKANPKGVEYLMGNLPSDRVNPSRPFENVGIDYFGPIHVREGRRRNCRKVKSYGVVFVCLATKAIHLELAGDLTSESFLAVLKRFMSRRGKPTKIYSDNGKQFVGANRELRELYQFFKSAKGNRKINTELVTNNIEWSFIPPRSPHFGGIWEAAVKSAKHHLLRVIGKTSLNYEELNTLLVQIEAILNSRPLTPLSNDPNDLNFLTPSHFLIGGSLMSNVDPDLMHLKVNQLSRWQYIQQVRQHFWQRWSKEYLNNLQVRTKWKRNGAQEIKPGILVIIRDENTHPLSWITGRVMEIFPGDDGIIRVATVKTPNGIFKRAVSRLCVLPCN